MVRLTINNMVAEVAQGTTILEAAQSLKIAVPTLCYDSRMKPHGGCRLCMVEIEGMQKPVTSCTTPAENGMVVRTESDRLYNLRKGVVELLLSDHPYDCMVCIRAGNCTLQELAYTYNIRESKYKGEMRDHDRVDNNPFVQREQNKCVLCGLCVRVCDEVQGVGAIGFAGRGFDAKICSPFERDLDCEFCGQCISVCPTGALSAKLWAGRPRHEGVVLTETTCSYCGCGCNITVHARGNEVTRISSRPDNHNRGWLCVKGRFGYEFINSGDRLQTPLIRWQKGGELEPASWEDALDLIATQFTAIREKYGSDALAGLASARCTNEENYMFQKLFRAVIGTNNLDHCARY
jgi:predicted molibdopterin-dependent oxidoreductase YjgC